MWKICGQASLLSCFLAITYATYIYGRRVHDAYEVDKWRRVNKIAALNCLTRYQADIAVISKRNKNDVQPEFCMERNV